VKGSERYLFSNTILRLSRKEVVSMGEGRVMSLIKDYKGT